MSMIFKPYSKEGHRTLGVMYAPKEALRQEDRNKIEVKVVDRVEKGGDGSILRYTIKPDRANGVYHLYFEDRHVVPYPVAAFAHNPQIFVNQIYATHAHVADRIFDDLGIGQEVTDPIIAAARTLPKIETPPPRRYKPTKPVTKRTVEQKSKSSSSVKEKSLEIQTDDRKTPVLSMIEDSTSLPAIDLQLPIVGDPKTPSGERRTPSLQPYTRPTPPLAAEQKVHSLLPQAHAETHIPRTDRRTLRPSVSESQPLISPPEVPMEERVLAAQDEIRHQVKKGLLPVMALEDKSGYYTNIIDTYTGQIHQVGYSWKKRAPWHIVFQLRSGINSLSRQYEIPLPIIFAGRLIPYGLEINPHLDLIYAQRYDHDTGLVKLHIRDILGKMNGEEKMDSLDIPPVRANYQQSRPVTSSYEKQPGWWQKTSPEVRKQGEPQERKSTSVPQLTDGWLQAVPVTQGVDHVGKEFLPSPLQSHELRRNKTHIKPRVLGLRVCDLIDPALVPQWMKEMPLGWIQPTIEPWIKDTKQNASQYLFMKHERHPLEDMSRLPVASFSQTQPILPLSALAWKSQLQDTNLTAPTHEVVRPRTFQITQPVPPSIPQHPQLVSSIFGEPYARLGFI